MSVPAVYVFVYVYHVSKIKMAYHLNDTGKGYNKYFYENSILINHTRLLPLSNLHVCLQITT